VHSVPLCHSVLRVDGWMDRVRPAERLKFTSLRICVTTWSVLALLARQRSLAPVDDVEHEASTTSRVHSYYY
jgi:hypothetical protein